MRVTKEFLLAATVGAAAACGNTVEASSGRQPSVECSVTLDTPHRAHVSLRLGGQAMGIPERAQLDVTFNDERAFQTAHIDSKGIAVLAHLPDQGFVGTFNLRTLRPEDPDKIACQEIMKSN